MEKHEFKVVANGKRNKLDSLEAVITFEGYPDRESGIRQLGLCGLKTQSVKVYEGKKLLAELKPTGFTASKGIWTVTGLDGLATINRAGWRTKHNDFAFDLDIANAIQAVIAHVYPDLEPAGGGGGRPSDDTIVIVKAVIAAGLDDAAIAALKNVNLKPETVSAIRGGKFG